ncbi:MAG: hypothetical protein LBQ19_05825 [Synergistaceae bacterium]|jgi:tRNA A-37 threonylcarbamoyl transferase component Bud32|nr:hypothetical protein [Synergistaceae bacterium]
MSYEIPQKAFTSGARVILYTVGERLVVAKRYAKPDRKFAHVFLDFLAWLFHDPILLCTDCPAGGENQEAKKLKTLRENGISVPAVLYEAKDYFVMEHTGENLENILSGSADEGRRQFYVKQALKLLRALHEKNFAHGGAQIKNFTYLDGKIYMIDFEEVIPPDHIERFKLRDLLIFAMSLEAIGLSIDPERLCEAYGGPSGKFVYEEMKKILFKYKFLKFLGMRILRPIRMNDVRAALALIEKAEKKRANGN